MQMGSYDRIYVSIYALTFPPLPFENEKLGYERDGLNWSKIIRSSAADWNTNVETIMQWSPFSSEAELFRQVISSFCCGSLRFWNLWMALMQNSFWSKV